MPISLSPPPITTTTTTHPPTHHSPIPSLQHYTKNGNFSQAFTLFTQLSSISNHNPNEFTLTTLLKACTVLSDPVIGHQLHSRSIIAGHVGDHGIRASLIAMYSSSGLLSSARKVFDEMPTSKNFDVPSWNSMISAHIAHGQYTESFRLLSAMIEQLEPTLATYVIAIGACGVSREIETGRMLHGRMIKERAVNELRLLNSLITFYSRCGELGDARKVFDSVGEMNVVSWNAMVAGYEQNGEFEEALGLFSWLNTREQVGVRPNRITLLSVLSAVSSLSALRLGRQVHAQVIRMGLEFETSAGNSLITMYGKCGDVAKGRLVFDRLNLRDVISWNSMLAGYAQNEQFGSCFELFREMQLMGFELDDHTIISLLLSAVSSESSTCKLGREVHGYLMRRMGLKSLQKISVCNAIITMYAKNSRLMDAEKIFEGTVERDRYTWNSMMDGYSICGSYNESIKLFIDLLTRSLQFDYLTLSILLTACGRLASVELGKQFHAFTLKSLSHLSNSKPSSLLSINNALMSMYSKTGSINDAVEVFNRMPKRNVFSWTALITGYAHQGMAYKSLHLFKTMRRNNIEPNSITFLGLLTACAHAGLVEEGTCYFNLMRKSYRIEPSVEHYACMIDLFGRAGHFAQAEAMVITGISHLGLKQGSSLPLWKVLLGACHSHKQLELGTKVASKIIAIDPEDETTHVLLSNLYASYGMWREAVAVRKRMRDKGLKKEGGCSWVEVDNKRHVFFAGDVCHSDRKEIYDKLRELDERCKGVGYVPMTEFVLHDVEEVKKEEILGFHSEKLAVAFAVLRRRGGSVIRVIKNLRVCGDCHNWMKYVSVVEGRELVLRDCRRFHLFKDGKCSCGDYW